MSKERLSVICPICNSPLVGCRHFKTKVDPAVMRLVDAIDKLKSTGFILESRHGRPGEVADAWGEVLNARLALPPEYQPKGE